MTLVERELGRTSYALQWLVARPSNILLACEGEQRERYLLPAIRGERYDCLAMTEPGAGSDVRSMTTRAVRDGDDYVIDGTKHFISNADKSDFVILFAATGTEDVRGRKANLITGFLVDLDTPGTHGRPADPTSVSHRGYHHCELVFEGCRVPAAQRLGEEGRGFDLMGEWLGASRLTVAATSVGRARRVLEMTTQWAAERRQFGQPIGRFQGVGFPLADMATELEAAELLTLRAAWKLDQGTMTDQDAAMAKLFASEALGRITDQAVQIFGGMGLMERAADRAVLARRAGRAHLGRHQRDPAPHHLPVDAATARRLSEEPTMADAGRTRRRWTAVLVVTLDRPKANAIDVTTSLALYDAFARLEDDADLRVGIVTGAGDRFFSAGWDLKAAAAGEAVDADHGPGGFAGLTELIGRRKPVIAAVNGLALGGGFELALAADLMVVAEHAEFALPEVRVGVVADAGGVLRLPRRLPDAVARELLLTGRRMTADEAARWGLANRVVPAGRCWSRLSSSRVRSPPALRWRSPPSRRCSPRPPDSTSARRSPACARVTSRRTPTMLASEDAVEGPRAFAEKRPPEWRGR